jgi:KUP system potassium uptake protein
MEASNPPSEPSHRLSKLKHAHEAGEGAALRRRSRSRGAKSPSDMEKLSDFEHPEDEDAGLRDEGGYKGRRVRHLHPESRQLLTPTL